MQDQSVTFQFYKTNCPFIKSKLQQEVPEQGGRCYVIFGQEALAIVLRVILR